jgi:hypothetical protein
MQGGWRSEERTQLLVNFINVTERTTTDRRLKKRKTTKNAFYVKTFGVIDPKFEPIKIKNRCSSLYCYNSAKRLMFNLNYAVLCLFH